MLSTKNIVETSAGTAKTLSPGTHVVSINSINLSPGYNAGSYNVNINVVGPDMGPGFEGFYVDVNDKSGPKHLGQVGRVRMSAFAYADWVNKKGEKITRDDSILRGLKSLAIAAGVEELIDKIKADTIEEFIAEASDMFAKFSKTVKMVCGGKAWDKNGYTQYDLFIPAFKDGKSGIEASSVLPENSKLITYDPALHITGQVKAKTVDSFEPAAATGTSSSNGDFEL